jgi:hypothetical protein
MEAKKDKSLPELKGNSFPPETIHMKELGDFLFHEGPFLTHCINEKNEDYLMAWCGHDDTFNRWMLYKTPTHLLRKFFEEGYTLRELILNNPDGFVFFVDINNDIDWKRACLVKVEDIEDGYLPGNASNFEDKGFEPYAYQLKSDLEHQFSKPVKRYQPIVELEPSLAMEPPANYQTKK